MTTRRVGAGLDQTEGRKKAAAKPMGHGRCLVRCLNDQLVTVMTPLDAVATAAAFALALVA